MSVSDARVWSEGQLRALMTEASAIVLPALTEWLGGSELNGVPQIAGIRTLKPFVLSAPSKWESCSSLSQFTVILLWIFRIGLLWERWARPPGLCAARERTVRNLRLQWHRLNRKNQCSVFSGKLNWFAVRFSQQPCHNASRVSSTLSYLKAIYNSRGASWNCR